MSENTFSLRLYFQTSVMYGMTNFIFQTSILYGVTSFISSNKFYLLNFQTCFIYSVATYILRQFL